MLWVSPVWPITASGRPRSAFGFRDLLEKATRPQEHRHKDMGQGCIDKEQLKRSKIA